jgi:hypothetical protein
MGGSFLFILEVPVAKLIHAKLTICATVCERRTSRNLDERFMLGTPLVQCVALWTVPSGRKGLEEKNDKGDEEEQKQIGFESGARCRSPIRKHPASMTSCSVQCTFHPAFPIRPGEAPPFRCLALLGNPRSARPGSSRLYRQMPHPACRPLQHRTKQWNQKHTGAAR